MPSQVLTAHLYLLLFYLLPITARAVAAASNGLLSCAKTIAEDLQLDTAGQQKLLGVATTGTLMLNHMLSLTLLISFYYSTQRFSQLFGRRSNVSTCSVGS